MFKTLIDTRTEGDWTIRVYEDTNVAAAIAHRYKRIAVNGARSIQNDKITLQEAMAPVSWNLAAPTMKELV